MSKKILVGLNNSPLDEKVLKFASYLSKASGCPLTLLHANEKPISHPTIPDVPELAEIVKQAADRQLSEAKAYLTKISESLSCESEVLLVTNNPAAAIIEEAKTSEYLWVITGASSHPKNVFFKSMSCNLSLYNKTDIPVITVNKDLELPKEGEPLRVLATEDLTSSSHVKESAGDLLKALKEKCDVKVVHVSPITEKELGIERSLPGGFKHESKKPIEESMKIVDKACRTLLEKKYEIKDFAKQDFSIKHGNVKESIKEEISSFKPHLVIFGSHKKVHFDPIYLGKIPFSTAFEFGTPFMITP